ncbi:FtsX-like permease family protein [Actinoalloteichus caeruleus]|uniref:FtsX-like permease family protein n=2 Tax=Actinoalloteichus cyanogriseus TaxID=2893586 RepID=UPI0004C0642F|nr:FtsX-like permease family protein [Actinoalloteichus caeruleus]
MLRVALHTLWARRGLLVGSFVALCLGVALLASTGQLLSASTSGSGLGGIGRYDAAAVVVRADQEVPVQVGDRTVHPTAREERGVDPEVADRLRTTPGVTDVVADGSFALGLISEDDADTPFRDLVGAPWSNAPLTPFTVVEGEEPVAPAQAVVSRSLADADGITVGSTLRISAPTGRQDVEVVGVAEPPGGTGIPGEATVLLDDATAASLVPDGQLPVALGVFSEEDPARLAETIRQEFADEGLRVLHGPAKGGVAQDEIYQQGTQDITALLAMMAVIALFVSTFVVAGTFGFAVSQRTGELSLLRALGATARQLRVMLVGEALILGVLASAVGVFLGAAAAGQVAALLVDAGAAPPGFHAPTAPGPLALAFVLGLLVALAGVVGASRRGSGVSPTEPPRLGQLDDSRMTRGRWITTGVCAALSALIASTMPTTAADGVVVFSFLLAVFLVLTLVSLAPLFVPALAAIVVTPFASLSRSSGFLASRNLRTGMRRTASTTAPVIVTVALAGTVFGATSITSATTARDSERNLAADVIVHSTTATGLPPEAAEVARAAPEVVGLASVTRTRGWVPTATYARATTIGGVDPTAVRHTYRLDVTEGDPATLDGESVVVSQPVLDDTGWEHGQVVPVHFGDGRVRELRIAAVLRNSVDLPEILVTTELVAQHSRDPMTAELYLTLDRTPADDDPLTELNDALAPVGAVATPGARWLWEREVDNAQESRVFAFVLIGMAVLYTSIAIANTLLMSAGGRIPELALLRDSGATRAQLVRMMSWEAVGVVLTGALLGVLAAAVSWTGVYLALARTVDAAHLAIPWGDLGVVAGACLLVALPASLLPVALLGRGRAGAGP